MKNIKEWFSDNKGLCKKTAISLITLVVLIVIATLFFGKVSNEVVFDVNNATINYYAINDGVILNIGAANGEVVNVGEELYSFKYNVLSKAGDPPVGEATVNYENDFQEQFKGIVQYNPRSIQKGTQFKKGEHILSVNLQSDDKNIGLIEVKKNSWKYLNSQEKFQLIYKNKIYKIEKMYLINFNEEVKTYLIVLDGVEKINMYDAVVNVNTGEKVRLIKKILNK